MHLIVRLGSRCRCREVDTLQTHFRKWVWVQDFEKVTNGMLSYVEDFEGMHCEHTDMCLPYHNANDRVVSGVFLNSFWLFCFAFLILMLCTLSLTMK